MRSIIFGAVGLALALAGCQQEEASPRSAPQGTTAKPTQPPIVLTQEAWAGKAFDGKEVRLNTPERFYQEIISVRNGVSKNEFETTAAYEKRKAELALPTGISGDAVYLFESPNRVKYDADQGAYVSEKTFCTDYEFSDLKNVLACRLREVEGKPLVNKRDVYGQVQLFEKRTDTQYSILMPVAQVSKFAARTSQYASYELPGKCPVPVEEARQIGPVAIAYGVMFTTPDFAKATMDLHTYPEYRNEWYMDQIGVYGKVVSLVCYTDDQTKRILYQRKF
ncbi:hypothetical protein [Stenotrophomonas geniculata]